MCTHNELIPEGYGGREPELWRDSHGNPVGTPPWTSQAMEEKQEKISDYISCADCVILSGCPVKKFSPSDWNIAADKKECLLVKLIKNLQEFINENSL